MKKFFIALLSVIILLSVCTYIFIPGKLIITTDMLLDTTISGASRTLYNAALWPKWWPDDDSANIHKSGNCYHCFYLNGYQYQPTQKLYDRLVVNINRTNYHYTSGIFIFALPSDSCVFKWQCTIHTSLNPITRIFQYYHAVAIKKGMDIIFDSLHAFLSDNSNIYDGFAVRNIIVKDSFLISVKKDFDHYPAPKEYYQMIRTLRNYMMKNAAEPTDSPMLNITTIDSAHFKAEVAIPVNKELENHDNIISKRLVTGGHILVTTVKGGDQKIYLAEKELAKYINDYQIIGMAIPFQSLLTNRVQQPDSSKWITKVYHPIF